MHVCGEKETEQEACELVERLTPQEDGATVVTLSGELGAGKTTFARGVAHALGVEAHITSPTFVIMKTYNLDGQKFDWFVHIDAYRLKGEHHLKVLGWGGLIADPKNLILVEWPEHVGSAIPPHAIRISLRYSGDEHRTITYGEESETKV